MLKFNKSSIKELKGYLYQSNIHDAQLKSSQYDIEQKKLCIEVVNPIYDVSIDLIFSDVSVLFFISGKEQGDCKTILSLSAEEDCSYIRDFPQACEDKLDESLYLLFQMFSGDELHVVCNELFIDSTEQ